MNKLVSRGLWTILATGGFMALGVGIAHADTTTDGTESIGSGNQGILGISVPITVSGNSISLLGNSSSSGSTTTVSSSAPATTATTSGLGSLLGGNQLLAGLGIPVTISGNSISVIGNSSTSGATVNTGTAGTASAPATTSGAGGIAAGNQAGAGISLPITVSGNAVSVIGNSTSTGSRTVVGTPGASGQPATTSGIGSLLGGNQLLGSVAAPITIAGNAISGIGDATSTGSVTTVSTGAPAGSAVTSGLGSLLGGNQLLLGIALPITLSGNAVSVIGDAVTVRPIVIVGPPVVDPPVDNPPVDNPPVDDTDTPRTIVTPLVTTASISTLAFTGATGLELLGLLALALIVVGLLLAVRSQVARR